MLTLTAVGLSASVLSIAACTHTTDRVVEPVGSGDASAPTPELDDAGLSPLTPIARPPESVEDYRMVRAPEFGAPSAREATFQLSAQPAGSAPYGGSGGSDNGGMGGSDRRPAATGGANYY